MSRTGVRSRLTPTRGQLLGAALLVNAELFAVVVYLFLTDATPTGVLPYVYPFVWFNAALWGVAAVPRPDAPRRRALLAAGVGVVYFLVLGAVGGLFSLSGSGTGFRIAWLPPGWGPAVLYEGATLSLSLVPYKTVGYAVLAYLVAVTLLDTTRGALSGVMGLFACVSCALPLVATLLSSLFGASVAAAFATTRPYGLSTVVFVLTVGLLVWRPTVGSLSLGR